MSAFIEPLILYVVLFLSGSIPQGQPPSSAAFSAGTELNRILLFNIPSLALIWYLLLRRKSLKKWGIGLPGIRDLFPALFAFPGLLLIGFSISAIAPLFKEIPAGLPVESPASAAGWVIIVISCISTGYLEESFFRFYLLSAFNDMEISPAKQVFASVLLFSVCHLYEGPWGTLNAVLAGVLLSLIFLHYRSLHGIALAHGLYNIFVYVMSQ
jgi:membrane protease YdiL (CAAX protease family)